MDPQSQSFTPYSTNNDTWRLQSDVAKIQQLQSEHGDRIARLERRQDEDARVKSVWGNSSPFPSVLSGTPQQGEHIITMPTARGRANDSEAPLQQPLSDHFRNFDEEANTLMSSLHLDAEDEPRRGLGANSRANSVRFDETANQNHFAHVSRPSVDFTSRTSSGLGGLQMTERSSSHKSEGRASSAHSIRSAASGRANSLNLDSTYPIGDSGRSPIGTPGLAPGLLLLGSVPAIIRCWMNTNFKHDALLYAAVCTGSYKSYLDLRLICKLGFGTGIVSKEDGTRTIELPVYFPEAVPHPSSSRSSSPAPQLPTLTVDFEVIQHAAANDDKSIQIFIGSDVLRSHRADVLFSSNSVTLYDDERSKLSIPLVRPESEAAFKNLVITTAVAQPSAQESSNVTGQVKEPLYVNGVGQGSSGVSLSSTTASPPPSKYRPPGVVAAENASDDVAKASVTNTEHDPRPESSQSEVSKPALSLLNTHAATPDQPVEGGVQTAPLHSGSGPAIWSNWRRDGNTSASGSANNMDWASAGKARDTSYQRKDAGIRVLKPKTASRAFSSTAATSASVSSPAEGRSRFFDDGRRKSDFENKGSSTPESKEMQVPTPTATTPGGTVKTKSNPIGGASAFSWLNSGGAK